MASTPVRSLSELRDSWFEALRNMLMQIDPIVAAQNSLFKIVTLSTALSTAWRTFSKVTQNSYIELWHNQAQMHQIDVENQNPEIFDNLMHQLGGLTKSLNFRKVYDGLDKSDQDHLWQHIEHINKKARRFIEASLP